MTLRRGLVSAALAVLVSCATPVPSATPTQPSDAPSPSPSMVAAPQVVCNRSVAFLVRDRPHTLTCENAVAAAKAVVRPDLAIASIYFYFGPWCLPGAYCVSSLRSWNDGHVFLLVNGRRPDILVHVSADKEGKVTAERDDRYPCRWVDSC